MFVLAVPVCVFVAYSPYVFCVDVPLAPDVASDNTVCVLLAAAVLLTEREARVPDEREVLAPVNPVPVVNESQLNVVV